MNFKKMSAKVMAVLMAAFMMIGFCAPAVSAADWNSYLNDVDSYYGEYADTYEYYENLYKQCEKYVENYEEEYAKLYAQADIALILAYLKGAKEYVAFGEEFVLGYEEYFRSEELKGQIETAIDNANKTIDAAIELVEKADKLDDETYAEVMELLEALKVNLADLAALYNTVAEDAYEYVDANVVPVVREALAVVNAKITEALEMIAKVRAEINAAVAKLLPVVEQAIRDFLSHSAHNTNYVVSADSYFLAIGNDADYAEILAGKLGYGKDQFGTMAWNELDAAEIAKADLITLGYNESQINHFAIDQLLGFVKNYINVTLRAEANEYAEEALNAFFGNMHPTPNSVITEALIENVKELLNSKIDELANNELIADAKVETLDWAALVGEENVAAVKAIVDSIVDELVANGVVANYSDNLEVFELIYSNVANMDSSVASMLAMFSEADLKAMFGEYATYTYELPIVDAVALAVESYIYNYISFNVEYAQTVFAINAINPDAKVILLSGYNAFDGMGFDLVINDIVIELGDIFTADLQNSANAFIDSVYSEIFGILDRAVAHETIEATLPVLNKVVEDLCLAIRDAQKAGVEYDYEAAIKNIDVDAILAYVGEENVEYALKLVAAVKFILFKTNTLDTVVNTVVDRAPTKAEVLAFLTRAAAEIEVAFDNLDETVKEELNALEATLPEIKAILLDLVNYVADAKVEAENVQNALNNIYDMIADSEIVISGTTIDLGNIFGELIVAPTSIHSLVYAYSMKNVIYVDISAVETLADGLSVEEFIMAYITDANITNFSVAGHAYIAEQIFAALNVTCAHRDADKDHICDYCDEVLSVCVDADKNHVCDYCGKVLSECADNNKDHKCDYCGKVLSECADENKDHNCDLCGKKLTDCADENKDHNCDLCGKKLTDCADDNHDHNCDLCGAKISDCVWGEWVVTKEATKKAEGEEQRTCSICGAVETRLIPELAGLSTLAIVAIVLGSVIVAGAIGFGVYYFVFKKRVFAK